MGDRQNLLWNSRTKYLNKVNCLSNGERICFDVFGNKLTYVNNDNYKYTTLLGSCVLVQLCKAPMFVLHPVCGIVYVSYWLAQPLQRSAGT